MFFRSDLFQSFTVLYQFYQKIGRFTMTFQLHLFAKALLCFIMPSLKKRGHIALQMSVGPSVTFSFPINNLRTP